MNDMDLAYVWGFIGGFVLGASLLTFRSLFGLLLAVMGIVGTFGLYWVEYRSVPDEEPIDDGL